MSPLLAIWIFDLVKDFALAVGSMRVVLFSEWSSEKEDAIVKRGLDE